VVRDVDGKVDLSVFEPFCHSTVTRSPISVTVSSGLPLFNFTFWPIVNRFVAFIQATQCIFGAQPTGYINAESDSNPASQILEIVRTAGKSG
jgi:hypothetical protein